MTGTPRLTLAAVFVSTSMLGACVNLAPEDRRPDLPTAQAFASEYRPDGLVIASQLGWSEYFNDPQLKQLLAAAIENNRDLVAATARIEQARAQYRIQDSARLPRFDASGSATRTRTPVDTDGSSAITFDSYNIGVAVTSFELDFWGRVRNLSDAARASYLATISAQRAFYLSLIGDVASTYLELIETREQIAYAEATLQSRTEGLRIAKLRLDAGITSALDYRQAEVLLTQAQQTLGAQRLSQAQSRNQLAVLVGSQLPDDLDTALPLEQQEFAGPLDAGLPSDLLLARPDIVAAEQNLSSARANVGAARAAFFPSISLTGSGGLTSDSLDNLFDGDNLAWSFGPSISLPIFDWGAREADLGLARALETEAVANYEKTVQTAFREVSDALAGRRWLGEQVVTAKRTVAAQEETARIARLRYREGVVNYLEVLDAERNLFSARQSLLELIRTNDQNHVSLFIALGGGIKP
ncbi:efflux transporter outer membrane subunit [uncultured Parasphingorhabdus sp.]|uniref:efflux transporter outer membrane subunit n=1 Tax=uncultured Parasphingorhabdus sp. TaxID=2709694 RepID=UPI002AA86BFF|nr:efflux transporter outer membrane subunit [uncultured Parasphingorhabdus sp.]